jgi:histone H3/H4
MREKQNALLATHLTIQIATIRRIIKECVDERAILVWKEMISQVVFAC